MELHGMLRSIGRVERITESFTKVDVILDTSTYEQGTGKKYENYAKLQFINDHINKLSEFREGDRVKIGFRISGKESTTSEGKAFFSQNLNAFKIEKI